jgi:hypothetical protein
MFIFRNLEVVLNRVDLYFTQTISIYSDSVWDGRSRHRTPVEGEVFRPVPRPTQPPKQCVPGLTRE